MPTIQSQTAREIADRLKVAEATLRNRTMPRTSVLPGQTDAPVPRACRC